MKHTGFLNSLKEWIKKHNDCPDSFRISGKDDLRKVYTKLETKSSTGGTFKAPLREFVYLENWDPEADGNYKPEDIVEETVFGKKRKGVWKNQGKQGHILYEGFDTKSFEETVQEEAGDSDFTHQAINAKRKVLMDGLSKQEERRGQNAVEAKKMNPEEIFALAGIDIQSLASLSRAGAVETEANEAGPTEEVEEDGSDDSQDSEESDDPRQRLATIFGGTVSAGSAPKSTGSAQKSTGSAQRAPPKDTAQSAKPREAKGSTGFAQMPAGKRSEANAASGQKPPETAGVAVTLDGRGLRLQTSARQAIEQIESEVGKMTFEGAKQEGYVLSAEEKGTFLQDLKEKVAAL